MAEEDPKVEAAAGGEGDDVVVEDTPGYKKPAPRALSEVMNENAFYIALPRLVTYLHPLDLAALINWFRADSVDEGP